MYQVKTLNSLFTEIEIFSIKLVVFFIYF